MDSSQSAVDEVPLDNAPVIGFIVNALTMKLKGNPAHFQSLVQQLRARDDQDMIWRVYHGLSSTVAQFALHVDKYRDLITAIFSFGRISLCLLKLYFYSFFAVLPSTPSPTDWKCFKNVRVAFVNLIVRMVSANATLLVPAWEVLVRGFVFQPADTKHISGKSFKR